MCLYEIEKDNGVNALIAIAKSNFWKSGSELVKAHMELGGLLGKSFLEMGLDNTTSLN